MNELTLRRLKTDSLREHSPRLYRHLLKAKTLEEYVATKAKAAHEELLGLMKGGYTIHEAWEVVRSEFLKPPDKEPSTSPLTDGPSEPQTLQ